MRGATKGRSVPDHRVRWTAKEISGAGRKGFALAVGAAAEPLVLSENDIKEELSYAYIHAIASRAGFGADRPHKDRDSEDVRISAAGELDVTSKFCSPSLSLQLKATSQELRPGGREFSFVLPLKNYEDLRALTHIPRLLVVFSMPADEAKWLSHLRTGLTTRRCAYWCNLRGKPATQNTTSQTVRVRRGNLLTPDSLKQLMIKVSRGEDIGDVL